tara:strand:- start:15151 stop:16572 length:1422 start_codon:yes stop_codon:yes gene_type:complete
MSALEEQEEVVVGGRYWLTQPLAVGGMAEVFLARQQSDGGFAKDVVIKRLRPELAKDSRVVSMFHDEARVSGMLSHCNSVHVFDSGTHEGLPYMAMEYIRGEELNQLCRRGIGCGEFLPLEHAIELIRQAALGMSYYHNLCDSEGKALDLVHCDISPNNLLIGQDGYLQVIDYGISQFRGQKYRDAQLVPGKLSYMSPEQAKRGTLDHRSDIFSLGIVLYEITLGRRLFRGPASEVLPRIVSCDIEAPTFVRHDYPGALESIVMRALEAEPSDRYQEANDFAEALGEYLREERMRTGPIGVARYLDRLAVAEGGERREHFISEAELDSDEEQLDFDRGLFSGFSAMADQGPKAAEAWDEVDEDESAVADALGIDIELVRTASRAATDGEMPTQNAHPEHPASEESLARDDEEESSKEASAPASAPESAKSASKENSEAKRPAPEAASGGSASLLMLAVGIALGVAGAFAIGAL